MEKTNQQLVASLHSKPPKNMATSCLLRYGPHPPYKDQKRKKVTSSWPTVFRPQIHFQVKTEAGTCPVKTGFNQGTLEQWTMRWAIALVVIGWGGIRKYKDTEVSLSKTVYSQNRTVLAYVLRLYPPYSQLPAWLDTDKVHKNTQCTFLSAALT